MIGYNLKIAIRNLSRQKKISLLNLFGLSVGMSVAILIFSFVSFEMSYDDFHLDDRVADYDSSPVSVSYLYILLAIAGAVLFIVCANFVNLSTSQSEKRAKETGIRKLSGAKVSEVMAMLNKDFVKWIGIAFVIACPIAYYAMHKWLEDFAYKTDLSWWIFALAGVLALGIALLTVSWQSWKAATRNPVEALRYE
ncbi:MAG: ABC transporter permease [Mangrovibacterium sp.]